MKLRGNVLIVVFFLSLAMGHAQSEESGDRYVFVISKVNYLKAIEDAVSVSGRNGLDIREVRVILCGESVKAFQEKNPLVENALRNDRVKLYACGLSLEQMKVDAAELPSGVSTVRNGLLESMILEKRGYIRYDL